MTTTPEAQEAAVKQRILQHMNADHHDSIRRYIEAYGSTSRFQSRHAQMTDIHLDGIQIRCPGRQPVEIGFDPPMQAMREARERLVQLDKDALQRLGRSEIAITAFVPAHAKWSHLLNFTQCLLAYVLLPRAATFQPGSLLYQMLLFRFPGFAGFVARIGWLVVFLFMVPIHLFEAGLMAKKLARHGCTFWETVWWKWVGTCLVEGITSFWRLDDWIRSQKPENTAKKH